MHVLGHSFSDVERPYVQALLKMPSVASAHWHVAYRSKREQLTKYDRLRWCVSRPLLAGEANQAESGSRL